MKSITISLVLISTLSFGKPLKIFNKLSHKIGSINKHIKHTSMMHGHYSEDSLNIDTLDIKNKLKLAKHLKAFSNDFMYLMVGGSLTAAVIFYAPGPHSFVLLGICAMFYMDGVLQIGQASKVIREQAMSKLDKQNK